MCDFFFFFNDTATTEIYPLSLHDALPISYLERTARLPRHRHLDRARGARGRRGAARGQDLRLRRSEEHTSELQSQSNLVCRLLLEKKKNVNHNKLYSRSLCSHATLLISPD